MKLVPTLSAFRNSPRPVSAHSILKKSPPRKRKSMERRNGARAERRVREALVGLLESPRNRSVRIGQKPPRTRSVRLALSNLTYILHSLTRWAHDENIQQIQGD